jgi:hypothetical protein
LFLLIGRIPAPAQPPIRSEVLKADFSLDRTVVYRVLTYPRFFTVIQLPASKRAKHILIGDVDAWYHQSDRRYITVQPRAHDIMTSLTIITEDDRFYYFHLVSIEESVREAKIHSLVEIGDRGGGDFRVPGSGQLGNVRLCDTGPGDTVRFNHSYRIKHNVFRLQRVYDDGTFTYLEIPAGRELPGIFLKRRRPKKGIEPVRYVVKAGLVVIHHVLKRGEHFILLLSGRRCRIQPKGR